MRMGILYDIVVQHLAGKEKEGEMTGVVMTSGDLKGTSREQAGPSGAAEAAETAEAPEAAEEPVC